MADRILTYRDLKVYRAAFELQQRIFELTKTFPKHEAYSLTSQVRDASRSVGANIAEAWQKRRYPAHFVSKLTDADAELAETHHWLLTAYKCDYAEAQTYNALTGAANEVGAMLGSLIKEPEKWCH